MKQLQNQVAIVTGGGRGIGKSIALALAESGAHVVIASRTESELKAVENEITRKKVETLVVTTDVSKDNQVQHLVNSAIKHFGRIDILVNNAGIGYLKEFARLEIDEFDKMWSVNMRGVFLATKLVLPHMVKAQSGAIVNIGSLASKNSFVGGTGYCATKWALRGFAGSLMLEVRDSNIRVISIFPGSVDTSFSTRTLRGNTITQPEDVAAAVVFAVTAPSRAMFSEIDVRPTRPK